MMLNVVVRYFFTLLALSVTYLRAEWNTKDFLKREHSLIKPYQGSGFGVPNWDFQGSTMVTSNYIRLTPDDRCAILIFFNSFIVLDVIIFGGWPFLSTLNYGCLNTSS